MTSQVGEYVDNPTPEGFINLRLGQPSPGLLPVDLIARAAAASLNETTDPLVYQYGARLGYASFRASLAAFLGEEHQLDIPQDHLMVSGSISLSLSLAAQVFGALQLVAGSRHCRSSGQCCGWQLGTLQIVARHAAIAAQPAARQAAVAARHAARASSPSLAPSMCSS